MPRFADIVCRKHRRKKSGLARFRSRGNASGCFYITNIFFQIEKVALEKKKKLKIDRDDFLSSLKARTFGYWFCLRKSAGLTYQTQPSMDRDREKISAINL